MYLCNTKSFAGHCKQQILHPFRTLQQDVSKVSLYNLGYNCALLELPFHSELKGIIFNFAQLTKHKLWLYN